MSTPDGRERGLMDGALLEEQSEYYRQRAPEYEDWWWRRGRYDQGERANESWFAQARQLEQALVDFAPTGRVLELACGTGLWTRHLARHAERLTALDGSAEMIALNRERIHSANVDYAQVDLFQWQPVEHYDACFFGFWLSHVPQELFAEFWDKVSRALSRAGRVFFVDSAPFDNYPSAGSTVAQGNNETMLRQLADGREYQIVKRFYQPEELELELAALGFEASIKKTAEYFIYATAQPIRP